MENKGFFPSTWDVVSLKILVLLIPPRPYEFLIPLQRSGIYRESSSVVFLISPS